VAGTPAVDAAWRRQVSGIDARQVGSTTVRTPSIWGDADDSVCRIMAEGMGEFLAAD
jgi:hypothetical protein